MRFNAVRVMLITSLIIILLSLLVYRYSKRGIYPAQFENIAFSVSWSTSEETETSSGRAGSHRPSPPSFMEKGTSRARNSSSVEKESPSSGEEASTRRNEAMGMDSMVRPLPLANCVRFSVWLPALGFLSTSV